MIHQIELLPAEPTREACACKQPHLAVAPSWVTGALSRLPVLSIRQPWAWAIITVGKDIENRSWRTRFRGRFLIHAAKGCTHEEYLGGKGFIQSVIDPRNRNSSEVVPELKSMDRGGVIGVAEIADCVSDTDSPWFVGEWGFVLRNVQPLEFLPCKGTLGFFHLPSNTPVIHA